MTEKEIIEKEIKVCTDQDVLKNARMEEGYLVRSWKVSLFAVDDLGQKSQINFVEKVEYHLHHTFANPIRIFKKPPFTLSEKGWGEFDMQIVLHFTDKSVPPKTLEHDLNFKHNHYEVPHMLNLLFPESQQLELSKTKNGRTKRTRTALTTSKKRSKSENYGQSEENNNNGQKNHQESIKSRDIYSPLTENPVSPESPDRTASSSISSPKSWPESSQKSSPKSSAKSSPESSRAITFNNDKEIYFKVNYEKLAENLYALEGDDILRVIEIVKSQKTSDMYINDEIEGEFHLDLYTLGDDLLKTLWEFTKTVLKSYAQSSNRTPL
ncbi:2905_t:CDS:2 [Ambispora gerdemannii]|uniref:2905_t:CDS:1 n=1 Tax=Ambispora gerdemannii TaxID=144530 RepID=A0A9N8ZBB9_9GLOM|nr:2905_t:CDS:2 [Ambispora gerdemannii]